ncbi:MAG: hypothetical protein AAFQ53_17250 [Bacteroidota bacterium]
MCRGVMVELVWVLERAYKYPRSDIAGAIKGLLEAEELKVEAADRVGLACHRYAKGGPGFSDQMILLAAEVAEAKLVTFDAKLSGAAQA